LFVKRTSGKKNCAKTVGIGQKMFIEIIKRDKNLKFRVVVFIGLPRVADKNLNPLLSCGM
jgi:hypothetical protein